jgi:homoserine O-acetyltransferase
MGGMTALAYAVMFPTAVEGLVLISSAARSLPFAIALRSLQREMIRRDPLWNGGNYRPDAQPLTGMRLARKLGMITYRSAEEFRQRFGRERVAAEHTAGDPFGPRFEIEAYLAHHADKFIGQYDPNCYLYLSRASDLFDIADHGASVAGALSKVQAKRILIIGVKTDFLFPLYQQKELADGLAGAERHVDFAELACLQGHDSFLIDMDAFRPVLARFFS